jgi:hypothetical protein
MNLHHVDTCLPCFVLDHCNGANEELVGVYVDSGTRYYAVKAALLETLASHCDKIAAVGQEQAARDAIEQAFEGVHPFEVFDRGLPSRAECEEALDALQAWFRFSWES